MKIYRYLKEPNNLIISLSVRGFFRFLSDEKYLKLLYFSYLNKKLNLKNPKSFNEKIQWLKLNDRNVIYNKLVDKYEVRKFVKEKIGEEYLIPEIGVYDNFKEIDFSKLPNKFVLKCTHDSGGIFICKDKNKLDINKLEKSVKKRLKKNFYYNCREWPYKDVRPRIICEKYMSEEDGTDLKDYKIFCFNGEAKLIQVDINRFINHKRNFYDLDWNYKDISIQYPKDPNIRIKKPKNLDNMIKLSEKLSKKFPHVRIDFYNINGRIYFGEITLYHEAGFGKFDSEEFGLEMGNWINLQNII